MKILQKNPKSLRSIGNLDGSEIYDFKTIQESKFKQESGSPYEIIMNSRTELPRSKQKYIAFITHGLGGNPFDMRHIRAALIDCIPQCAVYIINNNFRLTDQDINLQAKRLSLEVREILTFMGFFGN